jgi:phage major head subunit gpT-like protein
MPALTPQVIYDLETNMQRITENEYASLARRIWWSSITKVRTSQSKKEILAWLLSTARIQHLGKGGNMTFSDMVAVTTEYEHSVWGDGLKLSRFQFEDNDGEGFQFAADWSAQMGALFAYHPQKQTAIALLNGEIGLAYDGVEFFKGWDAVNHVGLHPYNPFSPALGGYANIFTGSADVGAGYSYPGACPIDDSVSVETAIANLSKVFAYIASIKQANGEDPRHLQAKGLIVPPRMTARAQQLTGAKFIAQAGASGTGTGDIEAVIRNWGQAPPIEAAEIGANFSYRLPDGTTVTGSDTTAYLYVEQVTERQLGGLTYVDRDPFGITYYTGRGGGTGVDAILDRADELEWHAKGRNVLGYGHPYLLFKLKTS